MAGQLRQSDIEYLQSIINNPLYNSSPTFKQSAERQLRLNDWNAYETWVKTHFPDKQAKILGGTTASQQPSVSPPPPKNISTGFVLHKKGTIPPMNPSYGIETHTVRDAVAGKWEGLNDIVKEATMHTVTGWGDIADINPDTGLPEGGAASYIDTSRPETPDAAYPGWGVPAEIPIGRVIGADPLEIPKPYNPWQRSTKRTIRISRKGVKAPSGGVTSGWGRADAERWNKVMMDWTAMQSRWGDSLAAQNTQMQSLAESASSIAYSNRFRIAKEVARFGDVDKRREFLSAAGIDPDAAAGRQVMSMADLLADRDAPAGGGVNLQYLQGYAAKLSNTPHSWQNWTSERYAQAAAKNYVGNANQYIKWQGSQASEWSFGSLPRAKTEEASKALEKFAKGLDHAAPVLTAIGRVSGGWQKEFTAQANGIYDAASYFVPGPLKQASSRLFQAHLLSLNSDWTRLTGNFNTAGALAKGLSGAATGAASGFAFGGPIGAIFGGIGGAIPGVIDAIGIKGRASIKSTGEDIRSRINLWSGTAELVLAPFRMLGNAAKSLWGHFRLLSLKLIDVVSKFNQLGLPLTSLTGVTYGNMQNSYRLDAMIGAKAGTTNSMYNSFAGAQMDLYTLGQLDESRIIAAAMTGTFSDVYGNGGDTQTQYANTLNKIYARMQGASPREQQRLMNLAGKIDNTMPARLQQMRNLGVSDYNTLKTDSWLFGGRWHQYTATQEQRARYTKAGMQVSALSESIGESRNVIAERLWSTIGLPLMGTVNEILHTLAETGNWRGALESAKKGIKSLWANIAAQFSLPENFGDFAKGALEKLGNMLWRVVPVLADIMGEISAVIIKGWGQILKMIQPMINSLLIDLSQIRLDIDPKKMALFMAGKASLGEAVQLSTPQSSWRKASEDIAASGGRGFAAYHSGVARNSPEGLLYKELMGISDEDWAQQTFASKEDYLNWMGVLAGIRDHEKLASTGDAAKALRKNSGLLALTKRHMGLDVDLANEGFFTADDAGALVSITDTLADSAKAAFHNLGQSVVRVQFADNNGNTVAEYERTADGKEFMRSLNAKAVQIVNNTIKYIGNQGE